MAGLSAPALKEALLAAALSYPALPLSEPSWHLVLLLPLRHHCMLPSVLGQCDTVDGIVDEL